MGHGVAYLWGRIGKNNRSLNDPENMKEPDATESVGQETHATAGLETGGTVGRGGHTGRRCRWAGRVGGIFRANPTHGTGGGRNAELAQEQSVRLSRRAKACT